jgi:NUMOD4 motif/HNH endonuclease
LVREDAPPREQGDERWLPVPGFEGRYEVSDRGRVRSVDRVIKNIKTRRWPGKVLSQPLSWGGYPTVRLSDFGKQTPFFVHHLVLTVFAGPCPEGQEALHGPAGRLDASIGNLHWGTRQENVLDRVRDGTHNRGARHGMAKLTQVQVDKIRARWAAGETQVSLAAEFGTTPGNVHSIVWRKSWSDT